MKKSILFTAVFGLLLMACKAYKDKQLSNFMVGDWQTEYIKVEMPTANKSDSLIVIEDDFNKPNALNTQSTYKKDGTFSSWIKKNDGSRVEKSTGKWKAKGDSLYVEYPFLGREIKAWYLITRKNSTFNGKVVYDLDGDGEFDDTLQMKSKRIDLR